MDMRLILGAAALFLLTKKKAVAAPAPAPAPAQDYPVYTTPEKIYESTPEPQPVSAITTPAPAPAPAPAPTPAPAPAPIVRLCPGGRRLANGECEGIISILPIKEPAPIDLGPQCGPGYIASGLKCVPEGGLPIKLPGITDGSGLIQKAGGELLAFPPAPSKAMFPAPTGTNPMPMLHWNPVSGAWVAACPSLGLAKKVILGADGKSRTVDANCPILAFIDNNGQVQLSYNQIYSLSNITRLPGGQVVY